MLGCASPAAAADEAISNLLGVLRARGVITEEEYRTLAGHVESAAAERGAAEKAAAAKAAETPKVALASEPRWFERFRWRGYVQFRRSDVLDHEGPELEVPADRSVRENESFIIRRGRMIFSGDATNHVSLYAQADFSASTGASDFSLQMRDYYADVALDPDKEYRVRIGQYKVPYGWVNLQSSQNRGPLERPDGINSAFEGERDIGAAFMWAPAKIRQRFSDLTSRGLKGSGDYGVFAIGAFAGQGPNRSDQNGDLHWVARASYPFQLANGQLFELGVQGYRGRFVVGRAGIPVGAGGASLTPTHGEDGVVDQRAGLSFVWYPQPFGLEAEWNIGKGPELSQDRLRIESRRLRGGYVQLGYRRESRIGVWYPFARWNYYRGGRKFATNAPGSDIQEVDLGFEWSPWSELELTLMYTRSFERTNTRAFPYDNTEDADRLGFQAQWNF